MLTSQPITKGSKSEVREDSRAQAGKEPVQYPEGDPQGRYTSLISARSGILGRMRS